MAKNTSNILLLQYIRSRTDYLFDGTLEQSLQKSLPESLIFSADNYSDAITINYARQFLQTHEAIIICHLDAKEILPGATRSLLHLGMINRLKIFANLAPDWLALFMTQLNGKMYGSQQELVLMIQNLNVNESASD